MNQITNTTSTNLFKNQEALIVDLADIESGIYPTFPFNITRIGVLFEEILNIRSISSTTVNNMTELVNLWNANVTEVKALEIPNRSGRFKIVAGTLNLPYIATDALVLSDGLAIARNFRVSKFSPSTADTFNTSNLDKIVEQLRRTFEFQRFSEWEFTSGNSKLISYYTGITVNNPSGSTSNIETVIFRKGVTNLLTQTFSYDINNNIISIVTT